MQGGKAWWPWAILFVGSLWFLPLAAQPYSSIELKKTGKYENRLLPAEKTGNKKFPAPKRMYQNTVSHFNYYFNAQQRFSQALEQAKLGFKEDYTQLLPFYAYSLDAVSAGEMDTILYKCTAGILLHDLRSDWVDRFYLLMANAYLHKKQFDSATLVLQYLNYAFAPKDDGYDLYLGSNSQAPGGQFTVSSSEKTSIWRKLTAGAPARNEGLLLQARVWAESGESNKAAALLGLLEGDPLFPKRLAAEKALVRAQVFYAEKNHDSAAQALLRAVDLMDNKKEKARLYYLAAQLKALSNQPASAEALFKKAIQYHADPLMEVYAQLNLIELVTADQPDGLQKNLEAVLAMAKKGIYQPYADILYYAAAGLETKRNNFSAAGTWVQKSLAVTDGSPRQRQLSWWRWADLLYRDQKYLAAAQSYDSIQTGFLTPSEQSKVNQRKPAMAALAIVLSDIQANDSLLQIAAMPPTERWTYLQALAKKINQSKVAENPALYMGGAGPNTETEDIFLGNSSEFYFDNGSLKSRGLSEFQAKWGNRPNIDNWRRQSAVDRNLSGFTPSSETPNPPSSQPNTATLTSPEELASKLPLDSLSQMAAWKKMAADYTQAIRLFRVELEDEAAAENMARLAQQKIPFWSTTVAQQRPATTVAAAPQQAINTAYEKIYEQFLRGDFEQALAAKKQLTQTTPGLKWTPQLLYLEALYHMKKGEDSLVQQNVATLQQNYPTHALTQKALVMADVLSRKAEIIDHLTRLEIQQPVVAPQRNIVLNEAEILPASATPIQPATTVSTAKNNLQPKAPSIQLPPAQAAAPATGYRFVASDTQYVALVMSGVDPLYLGEAKNALNRFNRDQYNAMAYGVKLENIKEKLHYLLIGPFPDAEKADNYLQSIKPKLPITVLPWLPAQQYRLVLISPSNLRILQQEKDNDKYLSFLQKLFPDKF